MAQDTQYIEKYNLSRLHMNDNASLYQDSNNITRRDAIQCLDKYVAKLIWKPKDKILDIGCADGSVTDIIKSYLPDNYDILVGCDLNSKAIEYANSQHGTKKVKFMVLDIENTVPEDMIGGFDHIFSFYTLHWIRNQKKAFRNIYNLLADGGECVLLFLAQTPMYSIFQALSESNKWSQWLSDFDKFASPYYDYQDPDDAIANVLQGIGFKNIDVKCKQKLFYHENTEALKKLAEAVSPFQVPKERSKDLYDDYIEVARDMKMIDKTSGKRISTNLDFTTDIGTDLDSIKIAKSSVCNLENVKTLCTFSGKALSVLQQNIRNIT